MKCTVAALAATLLLTGCGTTGSSLLSGMAGAGTGSTTTITTTTATADDSSSGLASLLGNILGAVLGGSSTLTEADLAGTWKYQSADCVFESENLLLKAGGEAAATKIESKLNETMAKVGIAAGTCTFTFNADKTYTASFGGRTMTGQYSLDAENKKLNMTYLAGLGTMSPNIVKSGSGISLLFDADKLLTTLQTLATLSGNSSMQALSKLASSYDGLMVGMELKK